MKHYTILSWNVNGIRAVKGKGFLDWLQREQPDILCLQETKTQPDQIDRELKQPPGYCTYWDYPERRGYSGVATFTRQEPASVRYGLGLEEFDAEGRVIVSEHPDFLLFNIYFPNGKKDAQRLKYKMDFYEAFLEYVGPLQEQGGRLIVCRDFNTAHKEIDLARPRENEKISGFLPMEREWLDRFVAAGFVDTFRHFNKEPGQYTWWDLKSRARERNVGWRIDYFFVTENLIPSVADAFILPDVQGSDHCPIGIRIETTG